MKQYKPMLKLKSRRLESGMTQAELAEAVGVCAGEISCYERGIRFPRRSVLEKIVAVLGCEKGYLLGEMDTVTGISAEELHEAAKPLIRLLIERGDPMMHACVTADRVDLYRAECGKKVLSETEEHPADH